jgi:hypothetical protein
VYHLIFCYDATRSGFAGVQAKKPFTDEEIAEAAIEEAKRREKDAIARAKREEFAAKWALESELLNAMNAIAETENAKKLAQEKLEYDKWKEIKAQQEAKEKAKNDEIVEAQYKHIRDNVLPRLNRNAGPIRITCRTKVPGGEIVSVFQF